MNISRDPPSSALSSFGMKMLFQVRYLNFYLFWVKFSVYLVRKNANMAYAAVRGDSINMKICQSPQSRKYSPRVISLATQPRRTFTQLCSLHRALFSFKKRKVRLFRGPMQRFAAINPAQMLKLATIALTNSSSELVRNRGRLPITSESTPVKKLPTAQARNVQSVRVSRSSMGRKITLRTNSPESQNSQMRVAKKRLMVIVDISYKRKHQFQFNQIYGQSKSSSMLPNTLTPTNTKHLRLVSEAIQQSLYGSSVKQSQTNTIIMIR